MRYAAEQKLEIIRLVENSHLGVKRTLDKLGVARPTFYRWYARYQAGGLKQSLPRTCTTLEPLA